MLFLLTTSVFMSLAGAATVTLSAFYPGPTFFPNMYVRGSSCGLNWDKGVIMTRDKNSDKFSVSIQCPDTVTTFEVKTLVDDKTWMQGSNHHVNLKDTQTLYMYPWFNTIHGTTTIIKNVFSAELNNTRDVIFYLPPSYNENTLKVTEHFPFKKN